MSDIKSGPHLGAVRKWIQWHASNGSQVTWGSGEFLEGLSVTAGDMDRLAQDIADALGWDEDEHRDCEDRLRQKILALGCEVAALRSRMGEVP